LPAAHQPPILQAVRTLTELMSQRNSGGLTPRRRRELRCSVPKEKWALIDDLLVRGYADTTTSVILLALDALHDKIIKRELHQARIRKLTAVEEDGMQ